MIKELNEGQKPVFKMVYKVLGFPVFSVTKVIDEEALYNRMAARFQRDIETSLKKVTG